jgi:hypothetical protein
LPASFQRGICRRFHKITLDAGAPGSARIQRDGRRPNHAKMPSPTDGGNAIQVTLEIKSSQSEMMNLEKAVGQESTGSTG